MNKKQKELLEKCINKTNIGFWDEKLILGGIYIIPTRRKHDSGYKIMYIIGHSPRRFGEEEKLYLIDTICDVVDFESYINGVNIKDLHIDMTMGNVIHIWSNRQNMKLYYNGSTCSFEMVEKELGYKVEVVEDGEE